MNLPVIEVAVIERDSEGHLRGFADVPFPEKWLNGKTIDFQGAPINLSHPARFLFNKIWFARGFDEGDLEKFAKLEVLSSDDIREVESIIEPILQNDPEVPIVEVDLVRGRISKLRELVEIRERQG